MNKEESTHSGSPDVPIKIATKHTLVIGSFSLIAGILSALPNPTWTYEWVNFWGALFVALGGLLAILHYLRVATASTIRISLVFVTVGGFMILGAALRAAMSS